MQYEPWWLSRLTVGQGRDELEIEGGTVARFETRQDQASWVHEFTLPAGKALAGFEFLRQKVLSDTSFSETERDTKSAWAALSESWQAWRFEASIRRDDDDQFGTRDTGAASMGMLWPGLGMFTYTTGRGFRAPTFFDLYAPASDFYVPNPGLRPEESESRELGWRSEPMGGWRLRLTAFDNRIEDLITYVYPTMQNVRRARIRGVEAFAEGRAWGVDWRGSFASQDPKDEDTGFQLQGRARRFGRLEASWASGAWTVSGGVTASSERYDSANEAPESRLPGYAIADATVRYAIDRNWNLELVASNLFDHRHEHSVGYDAPRRAVLLNLRFETR
jgi:vitamin B12 transporter